MAVIMIMHYKLKASAEGRGASFASDPCCRHGHKLLHYERRHLRAWLPLHKPPTHGKDLALLLMLSCAKQ
jgi:hypothetical protein